MQENSKNLLIAIELFWKHKIKLLIVTIVSAALSVLLALYLPNQYQAVVVVAPVKDDSQSQMPGLSSSIASLAGIGSTTGTVAKVDIVLETLQSKNFILDFIKRHNIKIPLMAGYRWDPANNKLKLDDAVYNIEEEKWTFRSYGIPPQEYVYEKFMSHLTVLTDVKTGIIKLSFQFLSPTLARQWIMWIVEDINEFQRLKDIEKSDLSIHYLQTQIAQTNIMEVQNIFFDLIKEQHKVRLLANTRDEYVLSVIDPAVVPDIKAGPKRTLIVIIGIFLGFFFGFFGIYVRYLIGENKNIIQA